MARILKVALATAGTAIAVAAAFFLHPRDGARRRAVAGAAVRRESDSVAALVGTAVDPRSHRTRTRDDAALAGRARLALQMGVGTGAEHLSICAERGVVRIRGEVDDIADIGRYETVVRAVSGVRDVDNLLRVRVTDAVRPQPLFA